MNKALHPNNVTDEYNYEEDCPHCGTSVPIVIDENDRTHYEITCPICGHSMMLCVLCRWDDEDDNKPHFCDWNEVTGCRRHINEG